MGFGAQARREMGLTVDFVSAISPELFALEYCICRFHIIYCTADLEAEKSPATRLTRGVRPNQRSEPARSVTPVAL
jgi:hypothetical protein